MGFPGRSTEKPFLRYHFRYDKARWQIREALRWKKRADLRENVFHRPIEQPIHLFSIFCTDGDRGFKWKARRTRTSIRERELGTFYPDRFCSTQQNRQSLLRQFFEQKLFGRFIWSFHIRNKKKKIGFRKGSKRCFYDACVKRCFGVDGYRGCPKKSV
jgi:hypothetical protein